MGKKIQYIGRYNMDEEVLGKGNFARVELATHEVTEIKVAIKVIDTKKIKEDYIRQNLHREAKIMSKLRHPNIIRLYETMKAQTLYCLVLEYASGGELLAYIKEQENSRLSESEARTFVRQLVSALHYIHEKNVVHRDMKMENIMLDEKKKNIKLIDFGLSNIYNKHEPLRTHCGSPEYAAPELFVVGKTYGPEIDIWSLGIITYAIVIGKLPFFTPYKDEYQRQRMLQQIQKGLSSYHDREMQILTPECRNLLHQVLEPSPEVRMPLSEIEIHPWITKNGKYPFSPYVQPHKDKQMRHQSTAELAIMTGIKRMVVEETVKEHKADELSCMFNMLMDKKRKQKGFFDVDHTYRKGKHDRDSRSRSRDREKLNIKTPDSSKGKEIKGKILKKSTRTKVNNVARPSSLSTQGEVTKANLTPSIKRLTIDPSIKITDEDDSLTGVGGDHHHQHHHPHQPALNTCTLAPPPPYHTTTSTNTNAQQSSSTPPPILKQSHNTNYAQQALPHSHNLAPSSGSNNSNKTSTVNNTTSSITTFTTTTTTNFNVPPLVSEQVTTSVIPPPQTTAQPLLNCESANKSTPPIVHQNHHQPNGPISRIPFSQRRNPPAKLNMTLDLSVMNTPRKVVAVKDTVIDGESQQSNVTGLSTEPGVAATSGVRPKISTSPKEEVKSSKNPVLSPSSRTDIFKNLYSPTRSTDISKKPLRPSTLQYIRTSLERVRRRMPSNDSYKEHKDGETIECKDCDEDGCDTKELMAPKATPEDSMIDSYSTSSSDGEVGSSGKSFGRVVKIQATVEEVPMQCQATMLNASDDEKLQHAMLGKGHEECLIIYSPETSKGSGILKNTQKVGDAGSSPQTDKEVEPEPNGSSSGQTLNCDVKRKDYKKHMKQLSFELDPSYDSSTSQLSKSSQNSVGTCPLSHVKHNLQIGSGSSIPMRFQHIKHKPAENADFCNTLPFSGSEPLSVGSVNKNSKVIEGDQPLTVSLSNPSKLDNTHLSCRACGLSPDSPTYYEKHTRFSHSGAHALDMFTSPDEIPSPIGAFWRPRSAIGDTPTNHGSPAHQMGILGCIYCFPTVGADTPRIPMQLPIASMEVFDNPDLLQQEHVIAREGQILSMEGSPETCPKSVHIVVPDIGCKVTNHNTKNASTNVTVDKQPCSKDNSICMSTVEAVYTPVPDTSLRLEPVGGSSESLDERVQGDGCNAKDQCSNNSVQQQKTPLPAANAVKSAPQMPPVVTESPSRKCEGGSHCELNKPSRVAKTGIRAAKHQVLQLLHWERSSSLPPPSTAVYNNAENSILCSGQQCLPTAEERKCERNKFLRHYDPKNKQLSWRQGLSHLLRKSRGTQSANNNITSPKHTINTSNKKIQMNSVSSAKYQDLKHNRCNSIDDSEEYYKHMDMKWTSPPPDSIANKSVSLEVCSSPVPSSYPCKSTQLYDMKASQAQPISDVSLTHIESWGCTECAKPDETKATDNSDNNSTKITKNGTSPIKKPVIIPNSTKRNSAKTKPQSSKV